MTRPRGRLATAALVVLAVVVVAAVAVFGSAALDWPARSAHSEIEIVAPRERIWGLLTNLDGYDQWNPVVKHASGMFRVGQTIELERTAPDGGEETSDASVLIVNPMRKLRWQDRIVLPGVRDREYEVRVIPAGEGRFRVIQHERVEGIGAIFTDIEPIDQELDLIAEALKQRAESPRPAG